MDLLRINKFLSTLVLVIIITGYPLVTTLLLPSNNDINNISQVVTIPFRAFTMVLILIVIAINIRKKIRRLPIVVFVFLFFWLFWILRMFYDLYVGGNYFISSEYQLWLYVFGICLPAILYVLKAVDYIDTRKALKWTWWCFTIILIFTLFSNQALISNTDNEYRIDGNIALNTISYGNVGVSTFLLCLFQFIKRKNYKRYYKFLFIIVGILAFYSILRAGSRGPIINLLFILLFWFFASRKNTGVGVFLLISLIVLIFILHDFILNILGDIAPVIEDRLRETLDGGNDEGRTNLYRTAINTFIESPFLGKQFAIFDGNGGYAYSHNIFLDSLMGLGILGFIMMIIIILKSLKKIFIIIRMNYSYYWIGLILLQQIFSLMLSGAFYQDQLFNVIFLLIALKFKKK